MHTPRLYKITDTDTIEQFIHKNGFATLISKGSEFPVGTHIPIELEINEHGEKVLRAHVSKGNPQWKLFEKSPGVLAIFLSYVHSYISSSWYGHPNAPTWNYMSVHIRGRIKIIEGEKLWESIKRLTDKYEQGSKIRYHWKHCQIPFNGKSMAWLVLRYKLKQWMRPSS